MKKLLLIMLLSLILSSCALFPTQEAKFTTTSIQVDGGRIFRDYEATEKIHPDGTKERTFSSKVYKPIDIPPITVRT